MKTPKWNVLLVVTFLFGCAKHSVDSPTIAKHEAVQLVMLINNTDVRWDGDYFGLKPTLAGSSKKLMEMRSEQAIPALLEALKDKQRFVAAHILLAEMNDTQMQRDAESWNGLRVNLLANGQTIIYKGQQNALVQKWKTWYKADAVRRDLTPRANQ